MRGTIVSSGGRAALVKRSLWPFSREKRGADSWFLRPNVRRVIAVGSTGVGTAVSRPVRPFPLPHHSIPHRLLTHSTPGVGGPWAPQAASPVSPGQRLRVSRESPQDSRLWHDRTKRGLLPWHCAPPPPPPPLPFLRIPPREGSQLTRNPMTSASFRRPRPAEQSSSLWPPRRRANLDDTGKGVQRRNGGRAPLALFAIGRQGTSRVAETGPCSPAPRQRG